ARGAAAAAAVRAPGAAATSAAAADTGRGLPTEHHRSAGGLVVRGDTILLISTQKGRRWQLPKGHVEDGETLEQTAVREVREETGVTGRVVAALPEIEYWYLEKSKLRIHKRVDYFLLEYQSGDAADFDAREVSGACWFTWEEGLAKLSFDNERRVAAQARQLAGSLALAVS
ncbi:MAG TPA: NUDIX hydrolase, partial [Thermoanaerobaculia bacterium]|nr:NUDIX hydrolase [Thermoanaerobaculia bacterium]